MELRTIEEQAGQPAFSIFSSEQGVNMVGCAVRFAENLEVTKISAYWGVKEGSAFGCHCIWDADTFELITRSDFISVSSAPAWVEVSINPITLEVGNYIFGVWSSAHSNVEFPIFGNSEEHFLKSSPDNITSFADAQTGRGVLGLIVEERPIQTPLMARMLTTTQSEEPMTYTTYATGATGGYIWIKTPDNGWRKGKVWIKTPDAGWRQAVGMWVKTPNNGWVSSI